MNDASAGSVEDAATERRDRHDPADDRLAAIGTAGHRSVGLDVPHALDEEAVNVHELDDAVGAARVGRQIMVDVKHPDRHNPRAGRRRTVGAARDRAAAPLAEGSLREEVSTPCFVGPTLFPGSTRSSPASPSKPCHRCYVGRDRRSWTMQSRLVGRRMTLMLSSINLPPFCPSRRGNRIARNHPGEIAFSLSSTFTAKRRPSSAGSRKPVPAVSCGPVGRTNQLPAAGPVLFRRSTCRTWSCS